MNEIPRAETWLYETLTDDPIDDVETVGRHPLPQGLDATYPAITYQLQAPSDNVVLGEGRVWAELVYLVTAIGKGNSIKALEAIADAIDLRLDRTDGAAGDDAVVISSTRDSPFENSETRDGITYSRLGGMYRLLVQPLAA